MDTVPGTDPAMIDPNPPYDTLVPSDTRGAWIQNPTTGPNGERVCADLSQVTGISVNELREFLALQRYQEARARYGSRYTEYLRYLGVRSSDARLQRPEYLGGGTATIQIVTGKRAS